MPALGLGLLGLVQASGDLATAVAKNQVNNLKSMHMRVAQCGGKTQASTLEEKELDLTDASFFLCIGTITPV